MRDMSRFVYFVLMILPFLPSTVGTFLALVIYHWIFG